MSKISKTADFGPGRVSRAPGVGRTGVRRGVRAGLTRRASPPPLYSSDIGVSASLGLALLFVANPTGLLLERMTWTKHLPMILGAMSLLLSVCGAALEPRQRNLPRGTGLFRLTLPFLLLSGWIIACSLYARFVDDIRDTFLTVGLYMLAAPGLALYLVCSPARWRIVGLFMRGMSCAAAFMVLVMVAQHVTTGGYYHELEYLVVPVSVYQALRPGRASRKIMLTSVYLLGGLIFLKLTGFIALSIAVIYLWLVEWRFRWRESEDFRRWARRCAVFGTLAVALAAGFVLHHHGKIGPDGNLGYRLVTYREAIHRFLDSPLYGDSFDTSATKLFRGFQIDVAQGHLPTHSDLLDLAANGGVLALALLVCGYVRILSYARKTIFSARVCDYANEHAIDDRVAAAHALTCTSLTGIAVYAFNPILLEPDRALLLWASAGMVLGMAICHRDVHSPTTRTIRDEAQEI